MKTIFPLLSALATMLITGSWSYPLQFQGRAVSGILSDALASPPEPTPAPLKRDWHGSLEERHSRLKPRLFGVPADPGLWDDEIDKEAASAIFSYAA